jgi:hypothetical protein
MCTTDMPNTKTAAKRDKSADISWWPLPNKITAAKRDYSSHLPHQCDPSDSILNLSLPVQSSSALSNILSS